MLINFLHALVYFPLFCNNVKVSSIFKLFFFIVLDFSKFFDLQGDWKTLVIECDNLNLCPISGGLTKWSPFFHHFTINIGLVFFPIVPIIDLFNSFLLDYFHELVQLSSSRNVFFSCFSFSGYHLINLSFVIRPILSFELSSFLIVILSLNFLVDFQELFLSHRVVSVPLPVIDVLLFLIQFLDELSKIWIILKTIVLVLVVDIHELNKYFEGHRLGLLPNPGIGHFNN